MEGNYSMGDVLFFTDSKYDTDNSKYFSVPIPKDWEEFRESEWTYIIPLKNNMQRQGWKVHISSTLENTDEILTIVSEYCYKKNVLFKHLSTVKRFVNRNGKQMPREHAGKFITCYPDESILEEFLDYLEDQLHDYPGPYILSDKRWAKGPIYLRYGMFKKGSPNSEGIFSDELEIDGKMVADKRESFFVRPDDSVTPAFLKQWLNVEEDPSSDSIPFEIERPIRFSNCGGIYEGYYLESGDELVFIKEARPHTGIDNTKQTAVDKLITETKALSQLQDIPQVPRLLWEGKIWEHYYLIMEKIEGITLNRWIAKNYPIYLEDKPNLATDYLNRAHKIVKEIEKIFESFHKKKVFHQDVHPRNFIIDSDNFLHVIDWEQAVFDSSNKKYHTVAAPGFRHRGEKTPTEIDWYGVSQIAHSLFFPVVIQSDLVYGFSEQQEKSGKDLFLKLGADEKILKEFLLTLQRLREKSGTVHVLTEQKNLHPYLESNNKNNDFEKLEKELIQGFDKTIRRWKYSYRNFPVHYYGLTVQHGISFSDLGILWIYHIASNRIGVTLSDDFKLLQNKIICNLFTEIDNNEVVNYGFGEGISGTLWLMYKLGLSQKASEIFQEKFEYWWTHTKSKSIYNGQAGIMLVGLEFASAGLFKKAFEEHFLSLAMTFAEEYLSIPDNYSPIGKGKFASNDPHKIGAGLLYGHAGIGWLFAELYRYTKKDIFLTGLDCSINNELQGYYTDQKGMMQYSQGHRVLPYLSMGSAGLGILISINADIIADHHLKILESLYRAVDANFCVSPGLYNGYAGLKLGQYFMNKNLQKVSCFEINKSTCSGLSQHLIKFSDGLCFAGDNGMRITTDIASGFAGVILALESITSDDFILLPKLIKERR
ncbi:class III lanthionine synthetase LanKC [Enterococcus faecium]|uniref:class III lanthionine synthetase LanKC n=1 Tax=Enterococcus faecium TaxID=1352 RepID=UPI001571F332|nr:protein kinase/lanthionine synthetase C family protein [Enterococcus faecium]EGP5210679.1 lanthionine synthetase [Enterococcus faecium]EME7207307.1 class III lanthionine synthetase LanKC [Enterococcus faecium]MDQ8458928.1 class III lanthionine synthetase LanKC [Enterococcus faecium]MDQ8463882.1 class III lanthionine synthetase LanKC [Enterococcus faecium]